MLMMLTAVAVGAVLLFSSSRLMIIGVLIIYVSISLSQLNTHAVRSRTSNDQLRQYTHTHNHHTHHKHQHHHREAIGEERESSRSINTNHSSSINSHHHHHQKVYSSRYDVYHLLEMLRDELKNASIHLSSSTCQVMFSVDAHAIDTYRKLLENRHSIETKVTMYVLIVRLSIYSSNLIFDPYVVCAFTTVVTHRSIHLSINLFIYKSTII